jgi:hypothetical protein
MKHTTCQQTKAANDVYNVVGKVHDGFTITDQRAAPAHNDVLKGEKFSNRHGHMVYMVWNFDLENMRLDAGEFFTTQGNADAAYTRR